MTTVTQPSTAKVFTTGRSQAVQLPEEFRFSTKGVTIERQGNAVYMRSNLDSATFVQQVMTAVAAFDRDFRIELNDQYPQREREPLHP